MGRYERINKRLREEKAFLKELEANNADAEDIIACHTAIADLRGALLEMAEIDGLDDYGEAFDY